MVETNRVHISHIFHRFFMDPGLRFGCFFECFLHHFSHIEFYTDFCYIFDGFPWPQVVPKKHFNVILSAKIKESLVRESHRFFIDFGVDFGCIFHDFGILFSMLFRHQFYHGFLSWFCTGLGTPGRLLWAQTAPYGARGPPELRKSRRVERPWRLDLYIVLQSSHPGVSRVPLGPLQGAILATFRW